MKELSVYACVFCTNILVALFALKSSSIQETGSQSTWNIGAQIVLASVFARRNLFPAGKMNFSVFFITIEREPDESRGSTG